MSKKAIDRKAAQKFVIENRNNGMTDQELYNELAQQYENKKAIALLITGTITDENKNRYKVYNNILIGLIGLIILFKILAVIGLSLTGGDLWVMSLISIVPLINIYFIIKIAQYYAPAYRLCGILTLISFFQSIGKTENIVDFLITLLLCAAITGLAFYLDNKLFPNYSPKNLEIDENGDYVFD